MKLLLESIAKKFPIDFVLYIGDDHGNEPVFTYLNSKKYQNSKMLSGVSQSINQSYIFLFIMCCRLVACTR